MTIPSDSENYDGNHELSDDSPPSSDSPMILYSPPTVWGLLRGAAINLLLPFVNGLMLGFGELFANELAFRFGWSGTKVSYTAERWSWAQEPLGMAPWGAAHTDWKLWHNLAHFQLKS